MTPHAASPTIPRGPLGHRSAQLFFRVLAAGALVVLSGCASVLLVDNQVQSFARWADPTGAAAAPVTVPQPPQVYRFERLPSQLQGPQSSEQDALENLAREALAQRGWTPAAGGVAPPWLVQVSASNLRLPRAPWESPWDGYRGAWAGGFWGGGFGPSPHIGPGGHVMWSPVFMHLETPYYQREVSLVIRQASTGRVVYETRAAHDGRWHSTPVLWSAMLNAALQGFPNPPGGARQVNIEVPR